MKNIRFIKTIFSVILLSLFMMGCEEDIDTSLSNFVGVEIDSEPLRTPVEILNNQTVSFDVSVWASERSSSDRTYQLFSSQELHDEFIERESLPVSSYPYFAGVYTLSDVVIPAGSLEGSFTITLTDDDNLGFDSQYLTLAFVEEAGTNFESSISFPVAESCPGTIVNFNLTLDTWPDETTWEIYDLTGAPVVIASGGPYVNPDDDFAELVFPNCLTPGDYGVVVYDSYGDGGPTFSVVTADGTSLVAPTTVGGANASATFTIN